MPEEKIELSVVLPCYNEEKNLPLVLEEFARLSPPCRFELICVENGSSDNSRRVLEQLLARPEYSFARMVAVEKNQGYGFGIMAGLAAAKGSFLAWSHADLQCPPKDVFLAYEKLRSLPDPGKAVVKGRRVGRPFNQLPLAVGMQVLATVILGKRISDINAQPKVFPRNFLPYLKNAPNDFSLDLYLLYSARCHGFEIQTVPVVFGERAHGVSNWNFGFISRYRIIRRMISYMFWLRFRGGRGEAQAAAKLDHI